MRIKTLITDLEPGKPGRVILICDTNDDIWHLYNIVHRGDFVKTITFRKVQNDNKSTLRKKIDITIKLEEIEYDQDSNEIRIKGKNVTENEYINIGQYQSTTLVKGTKLTIFKKVWDGITIDNLRVATDPTLTSDLCVVAMEEGVANIFLVSSHITTLKASINLAIPRKRNGSSQHEKGREKFFIKVLEDITKNVNFDLVKCVVIGSPGFLKDDFGNFMKDAIARNFKQYEVLKKNENKFLYAHCSCGHKQGLNEILASQEILVQIKNTKAQEDIEAMQKFNETLAISMDKVVFGMKNVKLAQEKNAIEMFMYSDDYIRKLNSKARLEFSNLLNNIEKNGGQCIKMSSKHVTGEKVNAFGGFTAVLKFVMPELNEDEEEDIVGTEELKALEEEDEQVMHDEKAFLIHLGDEEIEEDDDCGSLGLSRESSNVVVASETKPKANVQKSATTEIEVDENGEELEEVEIQSAMNNLGVGSTTAVSATASVAPQINSHTANALSMSASISANPMHKKVKGKDSKAVKKERGQDKDKKRQRKKSTAEEDG